MEEKRTKNFQNSFKKENEIGKLILADENI